MRFYHATIFLTASIVFFTACSSPQKQEEEAPGSGDLLYISYDQFTAEQMELGNTTTHSFSKGFKTTGTVAASPQTKADVYSYISGITKSISVNIGSYVHKGQELCTIESKDFIYLQEQYLESLAKLKATRLNYQRVKQLYDEKITSHKDFLSIESEYKMLLAKIDALTAELKILNVNLKKLEDGNLSAYLSILSPIDGTISMQDVNIGQFVDSQKLLLKIVDDKDLQLHFFVYQEFINQVKLGLLLKVYSPDQPDLIVHAKIISIGKSIDPDTKSVNCIAEFTEKQQGNLIDGMYFQVEVIVDSPAAKSLPSEAIIKTGDRKFVFIKQKQDDNGMYFSKKEVKTGIVSEGFTQLIDTDDLTDVLVKGAYYYQAQ